MLRSLITLKALTYAPTGGIVAALTTSLPEEIGGVRNWDYRFCWLRDGAFTVAALARLGYTEEAIAWGAWLAAGGCGRSGQLQIMYGIGGEHRLTEFELPVAGRLRRLAAGPSRQRRQRPVSARRLRRGDGGGRTTRRRPASGPGKTRRGRRASILEAIIDAVERRWREPDEGIWEVRGERQHFTYSKFSAWYAVDRALKLVEATGRMPRRALAAAAGRRSTRTSASTATTPTATPSSSTTAARALDASLLLIPGSGFLPDDDPRVVGTVDAVQRELATGPFVSRYSTEEGVDGLAGSEGAFLICSFWLVNALAKVGRAEEAQRNLDRSSPCRTTWAS